VAQDIGSFREERRVVSAMFADLVGSTALGERLEPEDLKLVVGDAVARMVDAVEVFGGTIKDLAGDGVLALFGAPVAHEDDPERAIHAGLRILEEIGQFADEVERGWGVTGFGVRVGVDTGLVVVGAIGSGSRVEYGALGDAVNTAARLQAQAEPGAILVGEETHRLVESSFAWGEPLTLVLKGKEQPVSAWPVDTSTGAAHHSQATVETATPLVGRARELGECRAAVDQVLEGTGGIVALVGEPGIGKTRLMTETRHLIEGAPDLHGESVWLEGRCVSYGEAMPYWPFRDLLHSWLGTSADEPALRLRITLRRKVTTLFPDEADQVAPYLAQMLGLPADPKEAERLAELSPEALQYRTFEVVRSVFTRLAQDGPVVVALEDLHWADPTSVQLLEQLLGDTDRAAILVVATMRPERDHLAWRVKEDAARDLPHRYREIALEAISGDAGRDLLGALIGVGTLPGEVADRILGPAEGNPFFLEEIVRSLVDSGAIVRHGDSWRFEDTVLMEIPPTVEKVILSRIDRLSTDARQTLTAASVLGRQFGPPLLDALADVGDEQMGSALSELQRLDLVRESRRWPEREYRFKHALIQEAAYRTLVRQDRERLHRTAAEYLENRTAAGKPEDAGLLAHHWLGASDENKAVVYLTRAGDLARQDYALDEAIGHYLQLLPLLERRGDRQQVALASFKLALALHMSLRFAEANQAYQRGFANWTPPPGETTTDQTLRFASSVLPGDTDPRSAIAWPDIQLCMNLFDRLVEQWPERTIVPNLAESWEIADDGLRYVFHLRDGLTWSDGTPLTARDVEFGIKRVLDPDAPGSSVAIYFVLESGEDYYLRDVDDPALVGVQALDDLTVEFRLSAPAPYFMSVMNRPDAAPQPRHTIESAGADWAQPGRQVVSGPFEVSEREPGRIVLRRRPAYAGMRQGNVGTVEYFQHPFDRALARYDEDELDLISVRYTARLADQASGDHSDATTGAAAWSGYLAFDHRQGPTTNLDLRLALARAVDRNALSTVLPVNFVVATGGVVPPALQGHTPDIALRFDPELARAHLDASGFEGTLVVGSLDDNARLLAPVLESWREVLDLDVEHRPWSLTSPPQKDLREVAPIVFTGWLPGYADPEYYLRLLFQSTSRTNEGGFSWPPFDELIESARQERGDRGRLELFHQADRMVVTERVACIPLVYGRSMAIVKPWVSGWREFGKTSANFADLVVRRP
jgi:ABC-type oligopeptide transport system substrate-binding subunit/class 3 adenylate cyclase